MPKKKKSSSKKRKSFSWIVGVILIGIIVVGGVVGFMKLSATGDGSKEAIFTIQEGESFPAVLENLEKEGWIKSSTMTRVYAKLTHHQKYYAGNFSLNDGMSAREILKEIGNPSKAKNDIVVVTVPEGFWAKQIAEELAKNFPYTKDEILNQWNDINYIKALAKDYEFLNVDSLKDPNIKVKLEGYLFPETYYVPKDSTIDEITRLLLSQFDKVYQSHKEEFNQSKYSVEDLVTLASIVQFESGSKQDMNKIAQVFYNRLDKGMKLQSSVTVCYALYEDFESLEDCETQYDVDSPYNTYKVSGLPTGPILNPGEDALVAVLEPEKNDYLFFVADVHNVKSNPGKVYYSKTLAEHEKLMEELHLVIE